MSNRTAIVTGGTGALGRYIVNKLSDEGIKVYVPCQSTEQFNKIFDTSQDRDSEYFKLRKIFCITCDATDENSVKEFVESVAAQENGKIDYLINTVGGISPPAKIEELTTNILDKMFRLNFLTAFYFTRETIRVMKKNNYGRIISLGAMAGLETSPGKFAYSFTKAGVINLMETVNEEMKEYNIRCNTIIPGIIDTPANREWGTPEEIKKWVKPKEISEIIYNLISEVFSSVRGSHIKVYGAY